MASPDSRADCDQSPGRPDRDDLARRAAARFANGDSPDVASAIRAVSEEGNVRPDDRPTPGRVRQHLQGMSMQAMGDVGYRLYIAETLRIAEELMTDLRESLGVEAILVSRAAKGLVDGEVALHLRLYMERPLREVVEHLVQRGYADPSFETADTRFGRLDRARFIEDDVEVVLTRCLPDMRPDAGVDLFTKKPIPTAKVEELRGKIEELEAEQ